jgi:serine/threonine protein phosphatase PrpC
MLRLQFHYSVAKQISEPDLNEDAYRPKHLHSEGPFVLSDGASESYDARMWSHLLVRRYRQQPRFDEQWVNQVVELYATRHDPANLNWSKQAAFERGSFATLLAIHIRNGATKAEVLAIGDSLAVLGTDGAFCASFPYTSADQFKAEPLLISTRHDCNNGLFEADPSRFRATWELSPFSSKLMAMTDALGAWLLAEPETRFHILASLRSRAAFAKLIETERCAGHMRRDDTTLLILE